MDYKLAKQLKEVGYPQEIKKGELVFDEDYVETGKPDEVFPKAYAPTLSELIEACGERFESFSRINDKRWFATYRDKEIDMLYHSVYGKTKKEAVAKLYIKLNKK